MCIPRGLKKYCIPTRDWLYRVCLPFVPFLFTKLYVPNHRTVQLNKYQAQLEDVERAVRFIHNHAEYWGIDRGRIGRVGGSPAGHPTLMLGLHPSLYAFLFRLGGSLRFRPAQWAGQFWPVCGHLQRDLSVTLRSEPLFSLCRSPPTSADHPESQLLIGSCQFRAHILSHIKRIRVRIPMQQHHNKQDQDGGHHCQYEQLTVTHVTRCYRRVTRLSTFCLVNLLYVVHLKTVLLLAD